MGITDKSHKEYLASDVWKCPDSPTGAHHWKEYKPRSGKFYCIHCFVCKDMPHTYEGIFIPSLTPVRRRKKKHIEEDLDDTG